MNWRERFAQRGENFLVRLIDSLPSPPPPPPPKLRLVGGTDVHPSPSLLEAVTKGDAA